MAKIEIIIAEDARERLERMIGRRLEIGPLKTGTTSAVTPRPFLRAALDEIKPVVEERLRVQIGRILRGESR